MEKRSAMETLKYTYCGTCLLRCQAECLHLERLRAESRRLCQLLRQRGLATATVIEMETVETVTMVMMMAQQVAAVLTQFESRQRC